MKNLKFYSLLIAVVFALLTRCSEDPKTVDPNIIGTKGGTVTSSDGVVAVEVPEDALSEKTEISVEPTSTHPEGSLGNVYQLGPDGTEFDDFIAITFTYTNAVVGDRESDLRLAFVEDGEWNVITTFVDEENNRLIGVIDHFTTFGMVRIPTNVITNAIWDVTINYSSSVSWHADVIFNADGTTEYDEPANPGTYLSHGVWSMAGNEILWDIGVGPDYVYSGKLIGNTMSGTSATGTWSAIAKEDNLVLCGTDPTPVGYVIVSFGEECRTEENKTYFYRTVKNITGLPVSSTVDMCAVEFAPAGWVTVGWTGVCSTTAGVSYFGQTIKKIEGMPSGTVLEICNLEQVPAGWELVGGGPPCAKVANVSFSRRTIKKL